MATIQDYKIIDVIRKEKLKAKRASENIPAALARDEEYYRKALASFKNAGNCVFVVSLLTIAALVGISIATVLRTNFDPSSFELVYNLWPLYIAPVYMMIVGDKISSLLVTPKFALGHLIMCLIINLLYIISVASIVSLIFIIIAMTRYSIYKTWFYDTKIVKR